MSVPKSERGLSEMEFYYNATKLRRMMIELLLKDFGMKHKIRTVKRIGSMYNVSEEDKQTLQSIMTKYEMDDSIIDEYPSWLINEFRETILEILRNLRLNIRLANSIYISSKEEYYERRRYWTLAICNCQQLLDEMQFIIEMLDVDVNKYMIYVEVISKEINLLKGVRKSDNRILGKL